MVNYAKGKINRLNRTPVKKGDILFYCVLLLIPIIQICIFYFGVNAQSFLLAFQTRNENAQFVFDASVNWNKFVYDISLNALPKELLDPLNRVPMRG